MKTPFKNTIGKEKIPCLSLLCWPFHSLTNDNKKIEKKSTCRSLSLARCSQLFTLCAHTSSRSLFSFAGADSLPGTPYLNHHCSPLPLGLSLFLQSAQQYLILIFSGFNSLSISPCSVRRPVSLTDTPTRPRTLFGTQ